MKANRLAIIGFNDGDAGQISTWLEDQYDIICYVNPTDQYVDVDPSTVSRAARVFSYPTKSSFKKIGLVNTSSWDVELKKDQLSMC